MKQPENISVETLFHMLCDWSVPNSREYFWQCDSDTRQRIMEGNPALLEKAKKLNAMFESVIAENQQMKHILEEIVDVLDWIQIDPYDRSHSRIDDTIEDCRKFLKEIENENT